MRNRPGPGDAAPPRGSLRARLAPLWARWTAIAHVIGNFQARVLLSLFYFVVVPPFALIVKVFRDPLGLRPSQSDSFWIERPPPDTSTEASRKQF